MEPFGGRAIRLFLVVAAVCALVVLLLAARVHGVSTPLRADARANSAVRAHVWGVPLVPFDLAQRYQALSSIPWYVGLVTAVVATARYLRDQVMVVVSLLGPPIALLVAEMVGKPVVARLEFGAYGFPSGHTTASAALAMTAALLAYRHLSFRFLMAMAPLLVGVPLGMVLAVVRIRAHLFSDAVAGVLLGLGTVLAIASVVSVAIGLRRSAGSSP
jgi:membrane-associated phospholipid phosphatase